jgi:hypothetical protein
METHRYNPQEDTNFCQTNKTSQIVREEILQRKWRWLGHTFRKTIASVTRHAITWNPQGKRRRGKPKITWQRSVESEMREMRIMGTIGMTGPIQRCLENSCGWSMHR